MDLFIQLFGDLIRLYSFIILAYVLIGYFPEARRTRFYYIIARICEPLLNVFRFATVSGISFAPILAIIFLQLIYRLMIILYG